MNVDKYKSCVIIIVQFYLKIYLFLSCCWFLINITLQTAKSHWEELISDSGWFFNEILLSKLVKYKTKKQSVNDFIEDYWNTLIFDKIYPVWLMASSVIQFKRALTYKYISDTLHKYISSH